MSRFLLTWGLGQGFGHLNRLRPLANELIARGHEVFLAARELTGAKRAFQGSTVTLLPAPGTGRRKREVEHVITYADLLLNVGFGDRGTLAASVEAWRNLIALVKPDLLVCDHSPIALLAAQTTRSRRVSVGTGFCCPVDEAPLRMIREVDGTARAAAHAREQELLHTINLVNKEYSLSPFERVTQVYGGGCRHFLMTFRELDHFSGRGDADYRGAWPFGIGGETFVTPSSGPCVFAYLKPFPTLVEFLSYLLKLNINIVIYIDGWRPPQNLDYGRLRIAETPVNIHEAATQCDVAVTNGTHGTGVAMLLAGRPLVQIPLFLEQVLFAEATARLGASITGDLSNAAGLAASVEHAIADKQIAQAAANFAEKHSQWRLSELNSDIVDEFEKMV